VKSGGVLIAQYNTEEFDESFGPYRYSAAGAAQDVTEEDSQIEVLQPNHAVLNQPNKIGSQQTFKGGSRNEDSDSWRHGMTDTFQFFRRMIKDRSHRPGVN